MFLVFTVLLFGVATSIFNCVRWQDIFYVAAAVIPGLLYYKKNNQFKLMTVFFDVYILSTMFASVRIAKFAEAAKVDGISVVYSGDNAYTVDEFLHMFEDEVYLFSLFITLIIIALLQLLYYVIENGRCLKKMESEKDYGRKQRVVRDRLYSLKATTLFLVAVSMGITAFRFPDRSYVWYIVTSAVLLIVAYTAVSCYINTEWNSRVKELLEKKKEDGDLSFVSMEG